MEVFIGTSLISMAFYGPWLPARHGADDTGAPVGNSQPVLGVQLLGRGVAGRAGRAGRAFVGHV